jgi:hypothetical protein
MRRALELRREHRHFWSWHFSLHRVEAQDEYEQIGSIAEALFLMVIRLNTSCGM